MNSTESCVLYAGQFCSLTRRKCSALQVARYRETNAKTKWAEQTAELMGFARSACRTDSLRGIPSETGFGGAIRTAMPGVSPSCMGQEQGEAGDQRLG